MPTAYPSCDKSTSKRCTSFRVYRYSNADFNSLPAVDALRRERIIAVPTVSWRHSLLNLIDTQSSTFHTGYALWFGCGCQLRKKYQGKWYPFCRWTILPITILVAETICCQAKIRSGPACNMRLWCTSAPTSFSISNDRSISSEYQDAEHYADTKHLAKGLLDVCLLRCSQILHQT